MEVQLQRLYIEEPKRQIRAPNRREARVLRFKDRKLIENIQIQEIGQELLKEIEQRQYDYCLSFRGVDLVSALMLGEILTAGKKHELEKENRPLVLADMIDGIYETFAIMKLSRMIPILPTYEAFIRAYQNGCKTREDYQKYNDRIALTAP